MQIWMNLILVLQLAAAIVMIGLVLVQHGKGADMGASFGSGASGSLFGATGSANFLSRSTAVCATIFFAATLGLSAVSNGRMAAGGSSGSTVLDRAAAPIAASAAAAAADLGRVGGDHRWYGVAGLWRVRVWGGRLFGERLRLMRAPGGTPVAGDRVDWWTVVRAADDELVLRGRDWFAGESLLGYRIEPDSVVLVGALRPRGVPGFLYWKLLTPVHHLVFRAMARRRAHPLPPVAPATAWSARGGWRARVRLEADRARAATMPFLR
jgi:preprotein translocase subunit SecG